MATIDPLQALAADKGARLQIGALLSTLRKHIWLIAGLTIIVPSAVGFVVSRKPKVYEATTSIVIEVSVPQYLGAGFKDVVEIQSNWWSSRESLETEFRVIRSFSTAQAVAKALCDVRFGADKAPALKVLNPAVNCENPATFGSAAAIIQRSLRVDPVKDSRIVTLTASSTNPQFAALLANTAARVYVEGNLEARLSHSAGAATWLGDEYGDLTHQLNKAQQVLLEFKTKNNIVAVSLEDDQNELSGRRKKLADELNTVEIKLIALRAEREQYAALRAGDPTTELTPGAGDGPVTIKLKELYLDQYGTLLELKGKYLEKHPVVIAQQSRVDSIRQDLLRETALAQKTVEANYQTLLKQSKDLRAALDATTKQALSLESKATEYNNLRRDLERLIKLSDHVGGREQETSLAAHLKTNNVRVLDSAMVPGSPIAPNVPQAVMVALLVSLVAAVGIALLMETLDNTVKSQEDIEKTTGAAFLGMVPTINAAEEQEKDIPPAMAELVRTGSHRDLYVLSHPKSSVAECCRSIRTNLLFMSPDKPTATMLVTSAGPQEGKTTVATNLAITLAQSGLKVLLVDTDMRRPRLHKAFGVPSTPEGLSKAVVGGCDVFSVIRETGIQNLHLLPCGACPPNPAELLHAERFRKIVADLSSKYDRVIFDSPPVGAVTDAAILARLTQGTILVAKAHQTTRESLTRTFRQISGAGGVNILGCVLNNLDLSKPGYGYQNYYSRYGYGYREKAPATADS